MSKADPFSTAFLRVCYDKGIPPATAGVMLVKQALAAMHTHNTPMPASVRQILEPQMRPTILNHLTAQHA
jgi:hypothetical protein